MPVCLCSLRNGRNAMKILLIRHGQTDWNIGCKLQGRTDIPLNETGRASATQCGKDMADIKIDLCITSPLDRAVETASLILKENHCELPGTDAALWPKGTVTARHGVRLFTDERLPEYCFGEWEGKIFKGPGYELPVKEYGDYWASLDDEVVYPGMEGKAKLVNRIRSFLDELCERYGDTDKTILVVVHGGVLRAVKVIANDEENTFRIKVPGNCETITLVPDEKAAEQQKEKGILPGSIKYGRKLKIV